MDHALSSIFQRKLPRIITPESVGDFSPKGNVDLSILILNYKTRSLLRQCLKSIHQHPPEGKTYEIIVIDNASDDSTGEMLEDEFPDTTFIPNTINLGFPKAMNQGLRVSRGRYVLLLNPDITVLPQALSKMLAEMERESRIAILGPKLMNPDGSLQYSCFAHDTTLPVIIYRRTPLGRSERGQKAIQTFLMEVWDHAESQEVAWMLGSALLVRREAMEKVGLMDERFFMYLEDVDWCRRFRDAGWRVTYYPHANMIHYYSRASASEKGLFRSLFNKQARIHIASAIKYLWKYRGRLDKSEEKKTATAQQTTQKGNSPV